MKILARLGTDTFFSADELGAAKRFVKKLWNAAGFAVSHLQDMDLSEPVELLPHITKKDIMACCRAREVVVKGKDTLPNLLLVYIAM